MVFYTYKVYNLDDFLTNSRVAELQWASQSTHSPFSQAENDL